MVSTRDAEYGNREKIGSVFGPGWQGWIVERCDCRVASEWLCTGVCNLGRIKVRLETITSYQMQRKPPPAFLFYLPLVTPYLLVQTQIPAGASQNPAEKQKVKPSSINQQCI